MSIFKSNTKNKPYNYVMTFFVNKRNFFTFNYLWLDIINVLYIESYVIKHK